MQFAKRYENTCAEALRQDDPGCLTLGKLIREKGLFLETDPPRCPPAKGLTRRAPGHCPNKLDALPQGHLKSTLGGMS